MFSWRDDLDDKQRLDLMLETAIDLAANGFNMIDILREFAKVKQFRALGDESQPMCRALTQALIGKTLSIGGSMSITTALDKAPESRPRIHRHGPPSLFQTRPFSSRHHGCWPILSRSAAGPADPGALKAALRPSDGLIRRHDIRAQAC
ncbi:hypothetical protein QA640_23025 [Bradyrhizobium sp. CB82]|uniref:hypothetical protein n=1 Tax=Bradyrhizobium sp. CB82 TaxID=3039159 RepID=UPI0024B09AEE|nr:hypothetical protein [Bradyrhizobium sp. CB82]WFU37366.1 hypothetical protein QA640_23025 [Bradyrhizobium sp. CB82]